MTRRLQEASSKDCMKGKRAFGKTLHYKCIIGALVDATKDGFDKRCLDFYIGEILKRAIAAHKKRNTGEAEDEEEHRHPDFIQ